jgi:MoaA/NifB/PqqE/SkfB family radical SAM enzyme
MFRRLEEVLFGGRSPRAVRKAALAGDETALFGVDPDLAASSMPRILWVELTSTCPNDCIFCTRRERFGAGRHMDYALYEKLIAELDAPDSILLSYFGESIYYPRLLEAISLAVKTGAATGLITTFPPIQSALLEGILQSGLDELSVSLHTMDPAQYGAIYGSGSLDGLKRRVEEFLVRKAALGVTKPRLDFCFVAMRDNLDQMRAVAEFARGAGARELTVHPVCGHGLPPARFERELSGGRLTESFREDLRRVLAEVRQAYPEFAVNVSNPDAEPCPPLRESPANFPAGLPDGARIHSCYQSPFESVRVAAGGDVVACALLPEVPLGNLREQSLEAVWHGERFRELRRRFALDPHPACRQCNWKMAYLPHALRPRIAIAEGMSAQLLRGWHDHEGTGLLWSRRNALAVLGNAGRFGHVAVEGILPHGPGGAANSLRLVCNGVTIGEVRNETGALLPFDVRLRLPEAWEQLYIEFTTAHLYRPSLHGSSPDSRDLGAGIERIEALDCRPGGRP